MFRRATLLLLAANVGSCTCSPEANETEIPGSETQADNVCLALQPEVARGMSVAHNYQNGGERGYGSATSRATLAELAALGVTSVSLTPFGFMRALDADQVRTAASMPAAETDARVEAEIRAAHRAGLSVFLKPHVWIAGGAWRGEVAPAGEGGWERFFASYTAFILHYARMAERFSVARFAVGVELPAGRAHTARWRALITEVRRVYNGEITYAANWDAVERVRFWDALDSIGVQFYPSLAGSPGAPEDDLREALERYLDELAAFAQTVDRPIILAEVGYKSIEDCELAPHEWPERHGRPTVSQAAQAHAYTRLFDVLRRRDGIRGVYLWKWFTDPNTHEEGPDGFSLRGKLAEDVVRSAYHRRCD